MFKTIALAATFAASATLAQATTLNLQFDFTGGFDLSVNDGPEVLSGQITFDVLIEDDTPDLDSSASRGRFEATSITVNAAGLGIFDELVVLPDPIFVDTFSGGLTIIGEAFNPDIGWNAGPGPDTFMTDINDLSTIALDQAITMTGTFFLEGITLSSGDTLFGDTGGGGPSGTFIATEVADVAGVPLPAGLPLLLTAFAGMGVVARKRKKAA